jgi:adenine-specific DNA-methyltransferase
MAHERLRPTFQFDEERLNQLRQIAPEAFADGKINWETLRASLGEHLEEESTDTEHFGLFWPGKRQARRLASLPSTGTLVPVYGEGLKADGTPDADGHNDSRNVFIEGENLEVLKLLQKTYAGRIKMIYIDPPYNTGNDFIYDDDFTEPLQEYLRRTGQVDEEGKALTTNKRADGRFHSKWLSMMYPRLRLARNLLRDDGLIFVSIDDNEVEHLRMIMNEIFGQENYQQQIIWKNKYGPGAQTKGFGRLHEYILCFSKGNIENINSQLSEEEIAKYKNKDEQYSVRGGFITQPLATKSKDDRPNLVYSIQYEGKEIWPDKQWIWSQDRLLKAISKNEIVINKTDEKYSVRFKQYLKDENGVLRLGKPLSILNGPFTQEGTQEVRALFNNDVFDFPKPSNLIKYLFSSLINDENEKDGIYLDFFAGSGTSAHAIFKLNNEDNGNRKFIVVQLPEQIDAGKPASSLGYRNIAELSRERIRLSSKDAFKGKTSIDKGFSVFSLQKSNFKPWQNYHGQNPIEVENLFSQFEDPLMESWTEANLTAEVLLTEGFPLDSRIDIDPVYDANRVRRVSSDFHEYSLLICLDSKIKTDTITRLDLGSNDVFICLDRAITDQEKLRLSDKGLLKTI